MLPIGVVSVLQGLERERTDTMAAHERLIESARAAATNEENLIASADQFLRAVGNFTEVRRMTGGCDRALSDALIGLRFFNNLARIDAHGLVACSALPGARGVNIASLPVFEATKTSDNFVVSRQIFSPVLGRPVLVAMLALRGANGVYDGAVSIVLDIRWLDYMLRARDLPSGAVVSVFDGAGSVMASNDFGLARAIFAHASTSPAAQSRLEWGTDTKGLRWAFATEPLVGHEIFAGFAMPEAQLFSSTYWLERSHFLMPILMIALAWAAIWFATERQVTQRIDYLRRVAAAYRRGHYGVRPDLETAPREFRLLGDALADMAADIQDRDRRLRDAVEQKSVLIREIHHRVKNNLQIVMSLLSLQTAQLQDAAAREALTQAQVRINALALVHRILHEIEDQSTIDLKRLIEELTYQVIGGMSSEGAELDVAVDILPREVSGDLAVPIALFTVEALTNIFKHAYPGGTPIGRIGVSLRELGNGELRLAIEDDGIGFAFDASARSIGSRLIRTFGQQIGGHSQVCSKPGAGTVVELVFPDPLAQDASQAARRAAE